MFTKIVLWRLVRLKKKIWVLKRRDCDLFLNAKPSNLCNNLLLKMTILTEFRYLFLSEIKSYFTEKSIQWSHIKIRKKSNFSPLPRNLEFVWFLQTRALNSYTRSEKLRSGYWNESYPRSQALLCSRFLLLTCWIRDWYSQPTSGADSWNNC